MTNVGLYKGIKKMKMLNLGKVTPAITREKQNDHYTFSVGQKIRSKINGYVGVIDNRSCSKTNGPVYGVMSVKLRKGRAVHEGFDEVELELYDPADTSLHIDAIEVPLHPVSIGTTVSLEGVEGASGLIIGYVEYATGCLYARVERGTLTREGNLNNHILSSILRFEVEVDEKGTVVQAEEPEAEEDVPGGPSDSNRIQDRDTVL